MSNPYTGHLRFIIPLMILIPAYPGGGEAAELGGSRHLCLGHASDKHLVINSATLNLPN